MMRLRPRYGTLSALASILLYVIALTGCAGRHYAVCVASGSVAGCSHERYTKQGALKIGRLLSGMPVDADFEVWIRDMRKVAPAVKAPVETHPQIDEPLHGSGEKTI